MHFFAFLPSINNWFSISGLIPRSFCFICSPSTWLDANCSYSLFALPYTSPCRTLAAYLTSNLIVKTIKLLCYKIINLPFVFIGIIYRIYILLQGEYQISKNISSRFDNIFKHPPEGRPLESVTSPSFDRSHN